ncbi:MAG: bifunctional [glutamine synthetase] adenylyltransferase/[glutamine synthetase]-adenylyl-L-tyrosine phosphorylase, partial [Nocardioides sp.]
MTRRTTSKGSLVRMGFVDSERSLANLDRLGEAADPLLAVLARTGDPDQALLGLVRLAEAADDGGALLSAVAEDEGTAMRLLSVLGASTALADHLVRHPEQWKELADPTLGSTRAAAFAVRAE